ncbi:MAG: LicD family protein [Lachnospiraceae bacterium]|nr:LicD family protein [Lachnospiraceae bacterium]
MATDIAAIQGELRVLLEYFHKLCTEHGIEYSLHGGTLLGAIREKGFIAWDDDADVTMERADYERFCELMKTAELPPEFGFVNESRFPQFAMKREGKPPVWTDIFVYDYISEKPFARKMKIAGTNFFILVTRRISDQKMSNKNGLYKGAKKLLMNALVYTAQIVPYRWRLAQARWFMKRFPGKKQFVHRSNDTRVGAAKILPAEVIGEYETIDFLGCDVMIAKRWHEVLVNSYGADYMTPRKDKPDAMHEITLAKEQQEIEAFLAKRRRV